jgi:hypothetical protein
MTIGDKSLHFQGKGTDLGALQHGIEEYLQGDGFSVQTSAPSEHGTVLQAKKGGFLRGVVDADRALWACPHRPDTDLRSVLCLQGLLVLDRWHVPE